MVLAEMMVLVLVVIVHRLQIVRILPDVVFGNLVLLMCIKLKLIAQILFQTPVLDIPVA